MREAKRGTDGAIHGPVYDDTWYRYVYPKGLDKQHLPKLIVAQTVPSLRVCFDSEGVFALNNVRVNGILPATGVDPWFLLGVLNAPVADWVFRRIAKPKDAGWFEANKQFIAPLPIPPATDTQRAAVAAGARELQRLHTGRRTLLANIARRLGVARMRARPEPWLFAGLLSAADREADAPAGLDAAARRAWSRSAYEADLQIRWDTLGTALRPGAELDADLVDGELRLLVDAVPVLDRIFVQAADGAFLLAQWKVLASTLSISERLGGKALSKKLRTLAVPDNPAIVDQVLTETSQLATSDTEIRTAEAAMNSMVFDLYALTAAERALIAR